VQQNVGNALCTPRNMVKNKMKAELKEMGLAYSTKVGMQAYAEIKRMSDDEREDCTSF
jgi:hypothetical protein